MRESTKSVVTSLVRLTYAAAIATICTVVYLPLPLLADEQSATEEKIGTKAVAGTGRYGGGVDPEHGKKVFQRYCNTCHVTTENVNRVGPSFHGLFGRRPGTLPSYRSWYSEAMKDYGEKIEVWNEETLFTYLESPRRIVKGTKMGFPGLPDPQDRRDVIAYLKTIGTE